MRDARGDDVNVALSISYCNTWKLKILNRVNKEKKKRKNNSSLIRSIYLIGRDA